MKQVVLSQFNYPWLPTIGMIIFIIIFIGVLYFALHKDNAGHFSKASSMPLNDGEKHEEK